MAQVWDIHPAIRVALDNNLVLIFVPAGTGLDARAELIDGFVRHVAKLVLSIGHKALTRSMHVRVAQLVSLVLVGVGVTLDDTRVFLETLGHSVVSAASLLRRGCAISRDDCGGILGLEVAVLLPVPDGVVVRIRVELDERALKPDGGRFDDGRLNQLLPQPALRSLSFAQIVKSWAWKGCSM